MVPIADANPIIARLLPGPAGVELPGNPSPR
nr:MAG TPA: hypothetical protein [Herelleviridae sp.]